MLVNSEGKPIKNGPIEKTTKEIPLDGTVVFNWPKRCPKCGNKFIHLFTPSDTHLDTDHAYFECEDLGCKHQWKIILELPTKTRQMFLIVVGHVDGGPGIISVETPNIATPEKLTEQITIQLQRHYGEKTPTVVYNLEDVISKGTEYLGVLQDTESAEDLIDPKEKLKELGLVDVDSSVATGKKPFIYRDGKDDSVEFPNARADGPKK